MEKEFTTSKNSVLLVCTHNVEDGENFLKIEVKSFIRQNGFVIGNNSFFVGTFESKRGDRLLFHVDSKRAKYTFLENTTTSAYVFFIDNEFNEDDPDFYPIDAKLCDEVEGLSTIVFKLKNLPKHVFYTEEG